MVTPRIPFGRINIDIFVIPTRNYMLAIQDELTKFSHTYAHSDKRANPVVNTVMVYFQHFSMSLRILCDKGRVVDNTTLKYLSNLSISNFVFQVQGSQNQIAHGKIFSQHLNDFVFGAARTLTIYPKYNLICKYSIQQFHQQNTWVHTPMNSCFLILLVRLLRYYITKNNLLRNIYGT